MLTPPIQILFLSLTLWGCSDQTDTTTTNETGSGTTSTTETAIPSSTTAPDMAKVVSFSSSEGEMVTEQVLHVELDGQTLVSVACIADISFDDFNETHEITAAVPALNHNLRLNGLLPETTYNCTTVSTTEQAELTFTTGALPNSLTGRYQTPTGTPQAGYMLFNTVVGTDDNEHWLVIQDYWGNIRWYVSGSAGNGIIGLEYEPDAGGIVAGGGFLGNNGSLFPPSIYDMSGGLALQLDINSDHDIDYLNGSLYFPILVGSTSCIQRWAIDDLEQTWEWCGTKENTYKVNSISISPDESSLLMTTYAPAEGIIKVNMESGMVDWSLRPDGSTGLSVDKPIFGLGLQHDVNIIDCDSADYDLCVVVYDNGNDARGYSQILEYGVNETKMTATLLRSFTREDWYETHSGGVHEMPNGEWLITIANLTKERLTSYLMVDTDGNEVWEMKTDNVNVSGYRARHIQPCDIFNHTGMCPE